ncbi:HpcH/HpaI aldolase/citrate lyase family protein [Bradyrhizobium sp. NP1]|uniref:HpcH/HpaI aldolase family protein n=1 Tax=Bradyrhizobium sp. NP1 TaxID=3049772 RepID=UPI0025A5C8BE|nr:HpcH/HpaI aldolase/citrate lyase family protein [Bradyrhizobium sp. NP1]WJR76879.1 HpcH/HpaI aldolase/citrate lyase family protein [Bradyrhizobium sp. NP1]
MEPAPNRFKMSLASKKLQIGLWSSLCSNIVAEILAQSGFNWILLDMEHSPNELPGLLAQLQAMKSGSANPVVRVAWNDPVLIKRVLDIGATSILVPFVESEGEAERAVKACLYPPAGIRGVTGSGRASQYGRNVNYFRDANDNVCVLVQIETISGLLELDRIAHMRGVDGVFIGPSDLAASMGHIGNPLHEDVQVAIHKAGQTLADMGVPAGILSNSEESARRYIKWGYRFVAVGSDIGLVTSGSTRLVASFAEV